MPPAVDTRVALLTSGAHAHLDDDLPPLIAALEARGVAAEAVDWHDASVDWAGFELVVIRSTWDYASQPDAFLSALERIAEATTLANPFGVVRDSIDKRYLLRLAAVGVPVVLTRLIEPGDDPVIPKNTACVVKPTISLGALDTARYDADDAASAIEHVARLQAEGRAALVQPYVAGVDTDGETGLVFLSDRFSHAFRKGPILRPDTGFVEGAYREEDISSAVPTDAELATAAFVLDAVGVIAPGHSRADLLYARVDLVPGPEGPLVMEVEMIEPSWFLATDPTSPDRAAAAILERLSIA